MRILKCNTTRDTYCKSVYVHTATLNLFSRFFVFLTLVFNFQHHIIQSITQYEYFSTYFKVEHFNCYALNSSTYLMVIYGLSISQRCRFAADTNDITEN